MTAFRLDVLLDRIDAGDVPDGVTELELWGVGGDANRYGGPWPDELWAQEAGPALSRVLDAFPAGSLRVLEVDRPTVTLSGDWSDPREEHRYGDDCVARIAASPACRALRELRVFDSGLTAAGARALGALTSLERLRLTGHRLDPGAVAQLRALLPGLLELRLD